MDDLVADIDRRAVPLQRQLDDADRTVDAGAEAARGGDEQGEGRLGSGHGGLVEALRALARRVYRSGGGFAVQALLVASLRGGSYDPRRSGRASPSALEQDEDPKHVFKLKAAGAASIALILAGCSTEGQIRDNGIVVTRSACPAVAIPAATGDVTLFNPETSRDAAAIDVVANMTNLRSTCD